MRSACGDPFISHAISEALPPQLTGHSVLYSYFVPFWNMLEISCYEKNSKRVVVNTKEYKDKWKNKWRAL